MRTVSGALATTLSAALAAGGCSSSTTPAPTPPPSTALTEVAGAGTVDTDRTQNLAALDAELETARQTFRDGLDQLLAGERSMGQARLAEASRRLATVLYECGATPGCEIGRFETAVAELIELESAALEDQLDRVARLETTADEPPMSEAEALTGGELAPDLHQLARTRSLLNGIDLRQLIELNGPVNAAIDDWLTWMRPNLMTAYENYQFLRPQMAPIFEQAGLPEALLFAMLATESGGKVHAYSRAGAAGPLQFMRYTGRLYGLREEDGFDLRLDPEAASKAAVAYLNDRFKELNDSLEMALAAYNGGEGRMRNLHRRYRGSNLWDSRIYYSLPRETREYVPRILAAAWLFLHPEHYNLEFPPRDGSTAELVLEAEMSISELSVCLGQAEGQESGWFRTLRNLNPRLGAGDRVEAGGTVIVPAALVSAYRERCLDPELVARVRALHAANYPPEPELIYYTVRAGDTLGRIASRFRCATVGEIGAINNLRPPQYLIRIGQRLRIPAC